MDAILARPDPRAATIDPCTVRAVLGERATADPVARLQQGHRATGLLQPQGGSQSREPGADHAIIDL